MGMAASQARLLSITARIHDVEYEAQAVQNAKVQLATLSDAANAEYMEALDATTLTLTSIDSAGNKSTVGATFNNLVSSNKLTPADGTQYALTFNGALIVENEVFDGYYDYLREGNEENAQQFAMYMLGVDQDKPDTEELREFGESVYQDHLASADLVPASLEDMYNKLNEFTGGEGIYSNVVDEKDQKEYDKTLKSFLNQLYKSYGNEIYEKMASKHECDEEFDQNKFNFYVSIYNQIQAFGGCVPIRDFDPNGKAENNTEWLQSMIQCGKISLEKITTDKNTGEVTYDGASPSSETSIGYTQTTSIDKTALAKAEAKYEHTLKQIDRKDKQYDLTLSKLETERSALTTEYDSVKKVIEDNIERTFGIFS